MSQYIVSQMQDVKSTRILAILTHNHLLQLKIRNIDSATKKKTDLVDYAMIEASATTQAAMADEVVCLN